MKRKTPAQKEAERMALLRAIRDGEKYTRRNDVLAPLAQAALIELEHTWKVIDGHRYPWSIKSAKLTAWGEVYLTHYENEQKRKGKPCP